MCGESSASCRLPDASGAPRSPADTSVIPVAWVPRSALAAPGRTPVARVLRKRTRGFCASFAYQMLGVHIELVANVFVNLPVGEKRIGAVECMRLGERF